MFHLMSGGGSTINPGVSFNELQGEYYSSLEERLTQMRNRTWDSCRHNVGTDSYLSTVPTGTTILECI